MEDGDFISIQHVITAYIWYSWGIKSHMLLHDETTETQFPLGAEALSISKDKDE